MKNLQKLILVAVFCFAVGSLHADIWKGAIEPGNKNNTRSTARCEPGRATTEMAVNNVRTLIHTGGDMWWDLQGKAAYEVPIDGGTHALFAGAIWVGGLDANGQLKMAAMKFRQRGIDYWPGPLIADGPDIGTVSQQICREYDKHFVITKQQVTDFREWFRCSQDPDCDETEQWAEYTIPDIILNWPAHGPPGGYDYILAPFWDVDGDGAYNPLNGDFPYYEYINEGITDDPDCLRPRNRRPKLFGDHTFWWVYNDKGNLHTETGGDAIGMEFRAQAFAFTTNDELNDMTFYNYNIINRSTFILYETYFGVWTDADLGNPTDDYVGCDVKRGLGYCYNGEEVDEDHSGTPGYGAQPPAIGIDFFEGPYQDPDGQDNLTSYDTINGVLVLNCNKGDILNGNINGLNFQDGTIDNERWGMRRFLYFNNTGGGAHWATTDPATAIEHYNYITGFWKDGSPLAYGGTGHSSGGADINTPTDFMFPGNPTTDPCGWGQGGIPMPNWSEETENNPADDRRFVQSAGPFTLYPGAVNDITIGAVWARAPSGGPWASVQVMKKADDKAQILFENCFRILSGPDAPELKIVELDRKLIFHIYNRPNSNNYLEEYVERDPSIICTPDIDPCDEFFRFQGYQVFQFKHGSVSISDRYDPDMVRQVFQCDIKDDVDKIVNYTWDNNLGANVPVLEVDGVNTGITHTFVIDNDLFAAGDTRLINSREYYYSVIAYGYNESLLYNQSIQETFDGQKKPYLAGRNNIRRYVATPHIPDPDGTIIQGEYGEGLSITQHEGMGNADNRLELSQETIDEIMSGSPWRAENQTYAPGFGPINVKVIDPLNVIEDSYTLKFVEPEYNPRGVIGTTHQELSERRWKPFNYILINSAGDTIQIEKEVRYTVGYEEVFPNLGISIDIYQAGFAGTMEFNNHPRNGFIHASMEFEDSQKPWLYFLPDGTGMDSYNWIRVGNFRNRAGEIEDPCGAFAGYNDYIAYDKERYFAKILGGTWAPYHLTSAFKYGPAHSRPRGKQNLELEQYLSSVDLVITSDTSLWTRAVVVEMCENEWEIRQTNNSGQSCLNSPFPHWQEVTPQINYRSEGNALRFTLRQQPSVNKLGEPDGEVDDNGDPIIGMSWFPGYAIDVRTGERLNIVFGEDSWLLGANGNDMMWNPSGEIANLDGPVFGGKHYIYIMGRTNSLINPFSSSPAYDSCKFIYEKLKNFDETGSWSRFDEAWMGAMWTSIPLRNEQFDLLATDVKISLRVATPYMQARGDLAKEEPVNDNLPYYSFSTGNAKTINNDPDGAVSALDLIRVVPNPYYGYSYYEQNQLDNYVRITNLPQRCIISIYNVNGTLVRRFNKDNDDPYVQWNLKNTYGIEIASGIYIVHVDAPGIGEKIVKWFGALRPVDLNNF